MDNVAILQPFQRQILAQIGNRYIVFGSAGVPEPIRFSPHAVPADFTVAPPSDAWAADIVATLRVAGMEARAPHEISGADIEFGDENGQYVVVDIKIRERDPTRRDLEQATHMLQQAASAGRNLEVWHLNTQRLKLVVMHLDRSRLLVDELQPLDVWEKTPQALLTRGDVINEVEDWLSRVAALYHDVQTWLADRLDLRCEISRSVIMSEEIMQQFAVTDREVPILDILDDNTVVASFVPRALWLIGTCGRIDLITRSKTCPIVALGSPGYPEWRMALSEDHRSMRPFDKQSLLEVVDQQ